jgi:predicted secreted protein
MNRPAVSIAPVFRAVLVALLALAPTQALAGDAATLEFTGFSKDGRYIAFAEYGVWDGSGFPWAKITFVDVVENDWVGQPLTESIEDIEGEIIPSALRRARWACRDRYERLGIRAGNLGTKLVMTAQQDLATDDEGPVQSARSFEVDGRSYTLILDQIPTGEESWMGPPRKLKLTLSDEAGSTRKVLQEDRSLPKNRAGAFAYSIEEAYLYDGRYLAVFLSIGLPGFEGPDTRYMAITGTLDIPR